MHELIYTSGYGFAIFFGIALFVFDTCFESAAIVTAKYRNNLRSGFKTSQYFWSRCRFIVITILVSIVAQVIAQTNPEAYTMTPPENGLALHQILLIAGAIASLGGYLFSILGWSKFTPPKVNTQQ